MKILHTSDWHLGAQLEQHARIGEQYAFIEELSAVADRENIDLILVAGDIYDTQNPPAAAEKLFYYAVKKLSGGRRPLLCIAGNHDGPERIAAPSAVLYESGAIVLPLPSSAAVPGNYGFYAIKTAGEGFLEIEVGGESAVILTMPFPSEKRLNELVTEKSGEAAVQKSFSEKIKSRFQALAENFRADTINLVVGHFHITGGETAQSERDIQFGGSFAVDSDALPKNAHYIAMGHLHRAQKIAGIDNGFYAGSPIQLSLSEVAYAKAVFIVEAVPGGQAVIKKQALSCYQPIELWETKGIEDAIEKCEENKDRNCWIYLKINSEIPLLRSEHKKLLSFKNIVRIIKPVIGETAAYHWGTPETEKSIMEEFIDYYQSEHGAAPTEEIKRLFEEIAQSAD